MVATGSLSSKNPASISELLDCGYHPESLLSDFDYWDYVVPEPNLNEDLPLNKPRFHVGEKQVEKKKTKILGFRPKNSNIFCANILAGCPAGAVKPVSCPDMSLEDKRGDIKGQEILGDYSSSLCSLISSFPSQPDQECLL
ncbi:DNA damage-inducible transcript 4-like protein isoform X4 [Macaca nemestrina]|uniref:DNA damage-inducible transcript 4-like protein isoform X4 n=1 Tax=Macaca nemestrina TaxID=9545 RepID=UPI0039B93CAB